MRLAPIVVATACATCSWEKQRLVPDIECSIQLRKTRFLKTSFFLLIHASDYPKVISLEIIPDRLEKPKYEGSGSHFYFWQSTL